MPDSGSAIVVASRADEINAIGADLFRQGQYEPARLHFLATLSLEPSHASALQNLGAVLRQMLHYEAAASVARRSVMLTQGKNPYCRSNLGVSMLALKQFNVAKDLLYGVTRDLPEAAESWHNYGLVLYMLGQYEEALEVFNKSLAINPSNNQCRSDKSLTLLSLGRIAEGLASYEVRWKLLQKNKIWATNVREWQGEDLAGQHILVHHEQGFGDSLMLSRFLLPLQKLGCSITLAVPAELMRLFEYNFDFAKVIDINDEMLDDPSAFDYHSPLLSVMRWLGIKEPSDIDLSPYLKAKQLSKLNFPQSQLRVGICWASGDHGHGLTERRRVVSLTSFLPLVELQGVTLISLQKGSAGGEIVKHGMEGMVFDVTHRLEDFAATADVIAQLDLVVSVDSAVVHLAAAMGKPTLMLGPYSRCWRWWNAADGLPWYEDLKTFRQSQNGTWDVAMNEVLYEVASKL